MNDYIFVIRSSNESTVERLKADIFALTGTNDYVCLNEKPFHAALKAGFNIGKSAPHAKWLVCLDGDIIISKKRLMSFLEQLSDPGENLLLTQPMVFDGIFRKHRYAGIHIYNNRLSTSLLEWCDKCDFQNIHRPEAHLIHSYVRKGYINEKSNRIVALHDFGQNKKDVFRKSFFHGIKHLKDLSYLADIHKNQPDTISEIVLRGLAQSLLTKHFDYSKNSIDVPHDLDEEVSQVLDIELILSEADICIKRELLEQKIHRRAWKKFLSIIS